MVVSILYLIFQRFSGLLKRLAWSSCSAIFAFSSGVMHTADVRTAEQWPYIDMTAVETQLDGAGPWALDGKLELTGAGIPAGRQFVLQLLPALRELVADGVVKPMHVNTKANLADLFTKPLTGRRFVYLRNKAMNIKA